MTKEFLINFVKLMEKDSLSESDLELVSLGNSLGLNLEPLSKLWASQEESFVDKIRDKALQSMSSHHQNTLDHKDSFYSGSIDFMIRTFDGNIDYFLLETNGASHRGLSILTKKQQSMVYEGYFGAVSQAIQKNENDTGKILIVVGVPINDGLIHEKALLLDYLRNKITQKGFKTRVFNVYTYKSNFTEDIAFLIADYQQLLSTLSFENYWVKFKNDKVNVLIGDGIARRIEDPQFKALIRNDFRKIRSIIINPVYLATDDKALSYLAKHFVNEKLESYHIAKFLFTRAFNEEDLISKIKTAIQKYNKPFVIKPYAGSGGAGVMPIFPHKLNQEETKIRKIISDSKEEFYVKFMNNRTPYPYTIQEMAKFSLINWNEGRRTYDLRIYLSQIEDKIIPIGGLARIARGAYISGIRKEEFVVNLSGYGGKIEVERGLGLSEKASKVLNLELNHFVDIFCNSCIIFKSIADNYQRIINFSDWDKFIGPK
ncbi:MAG: hypothetical protein BAJALOKI1v1_1840003 [Promethearchaeota archaeon]|nr:MAG: hypothetical protein BAJALOKI1v1_1840003 [Candidatus Lokiarchaeota archaeon]